MGLWQGDGYIKKKLQKKRKTEEKGWIQKMDMPISEILDINK